MTDKEKKEWAQKIQSKDKFNKNQKEYKKALEIWEKENKEYNQQLEVYNQHVKREKILKNSGKLLNEASEKKDIKKVKQIFELFESIEEKKSLSNYQDLAKDSPLMYSAREGSLEIVQYLIDQGAEVDLKNEDNMTALHYACLHARTDVIVLLVSKGCDTNIKGKCVVGSKILDRTAAHIAGVCGFLTEYQYLLQNGALPPFSCMSSPHLEVVKLTHEFGANINGRFSSDYTPLMIHAVFGNTEIVKYLLDNGADASLTITERWTNKISTALDLAMLKGKSNIAKMILMKSSGVKFFGSGTRLYMEKDCSICKEKYDYEKDHVYALSCGHIFHEECVSSYVSSKQKCPMCRSSLQ
jgi:ankyrin repeat protein